MEDQSDATSINPYMALRAAKIARNQARLQELGLHKPALTKPLVARSREPESVTKRNKSSDAGDVSTAGPRRRSLRISGLSINPNYFEIKDLKERALSHPNSEQRGTKRLLDATRADSMLVTDDRMKLSTIPSRVSTSSRQKTAPAASANSVRTVSLDVSILVQKFLAKPLEIFGKYFVIERSFYDAAYPEDQQRLCGIPRLSFNKFSGVQPWKNVIFLWINVGGPTDANSVVNEFIHNGSHVTWFGGSKMTEESPVIQTLIRMGKETASTPSSTSSGIILWCRRYNWPTRKLLPYICLGRLAYDSHIPGSYPVNFTWRLIDYESMIGNETTRKVFGEISGSE